MPAIPLGLKAYRRASAFVPEARLLNMWLEKDESGVSPDGTMRVQRPGISRSAVLGGPMRGFLYRTLTGQEYAVSGSQLYIDRVAVGSVNGVGIASMTETDAAVAILGGGTVYLYTTSLSPVVLPDDAEGFPVDIDQINGYILILMSTGRFYWIKPGETVVDALDFATAERSPDRAVAIKRVADEFWIFGTDTTEPWQPTGDDQSPFQPVIGRVYERGCLSRDSVQRFDNSVMWVADDGLTCRGGAVPVVVSDAGLAERVRKATGAVSAFTFGWDGHDFYVLTIPGQGTFGFDASTQAWCEFGTIGEVGWRPLVAYQAGTGVVLGSKQDGTLWVLDGDNGTDDGQPIERVLTGTLPLLGKPGRNDSFSVGVGSSGDTTVRLRWKDGQDDFPAYYDDLDVRAPLDVATIYRLGMPDQPYRTFEVSCIAPERIRVAGAMVNEAWQ